MQRVAIMGLGLMGGSLGMALRTCAAGEFRTVGWARREETRMLAQKLGCVDEVTETPEVAARGADLVVLCVPILAMGEVLLACRGGLKKGCIVTDVGSTKKELARRLPPLLKESGAVYCGSHPIAGSEQQGLDAARRDLYKGALVVVTPEHDPRPDVVVSVSMLWEKVGARVRIMSADEHDRIVARTSHLPHLIAVALSLAVGRDDSAESVGAFCGAGFRDSTRVADGAPEIWRDIVETNRTCVVRELEAFRESFEKLSRAIAEENMHDVFELLSEARERRRRLMAVQGEHERKRTP